MPDKSLNPRVPQSELTLVESFPGETFKLRVTCLAVCVFTVCANAQTFELSLSKAAVERTGHSVLYDGSYRSIPYPGGDVPSNIGVCTDVVIRSYRRLGIDLQQLVHEDMSANFDEYPSRRIWGLDRPDSNIDHRRVPNLQAFLQRNGTSLPVSQSAEDYLAGDIVTWRLAGNLPHIGIVTSQVSDFTGNPMMVHNIGAGPRLEDVLFEYVITGHYRYAP